MLTPISKGSDSIFMTTQNQFFTGCSCQSERCPQSFNMHVRMKKHAMIIICSCVLFLPGCMAFLSESTEKNARESSPSWAREISTDKAFLKNDTAQYSLSDIKSNRNSPETASRKKKENKRTEKKRFDYLNKSLKSLPDYSLARKKTSGKKKNASRPTSEKKSSNPSPFNSDNINWKNYTRKSGYSTGNENVNILVNNPKEEKKPVNQTNREPLSKIETRYNRYGELTKGKKIRQFGYNIVRFALPGHTPTPNWGEDFIREKKGAPVFSQDAATRLFSHSRESNAPYFSNEYSGMRPVPSEYIIAPGDEIFIKITGPADIAEVFAVDRNGQLFIPRIGAINLAGRNAGELQGLVTKKVKEVFNQAFVEASLGRLRSIQVTVTGNVRTPGLIKVPANSSLLNALAAAGGAAKNGSLRKIVLRRRNIGCQSIIPGEKKTKQLTIQHSNNKKAMEKHIDLYEILIKGDWNHDPAVLPGDIIYVPPIGKTIAIIAPGDTGAIYEINPKETLGDLGNNIGITENFTDLESVLVERHGATQDRMISMLDYKAGAISFLLEDGDIFHFFPTHSYAYNGVAILGPVVRPGTYPFIENMRVSDLLKLSKGFLINAALDRAFLIRELGRDTRFDIMPDDGRGTHRKQLIRLDLAGILAGNEKADIPLSRLDRLKLLTMNDRRPEPVVSISGGIRKPGEYHLTAGMTLGDLLDIAGGPSEKAYDGESSIVRRRYTKDGRHHFDVGIIPFDLKAVIDREDASRILLKNNDKIVIRQVNNLEISAKIEGWVHFPGTYILPSGSRIEDLVRLAGGFLSGADLRASVFRRRRVSNLETTGLKKFYATSTERFARVRDRVTLSGHPSESLANQLSLLGQDRLYTNMGKFQTTGRIVIDLTTDDFPDTDDNLVLEDGDALSVPQKMTTIMVMGRIFNPCAYLWKKGLSVEDYLNKSGGLLDDADANHIYVVMANGEVKSTAQKKGGNRLLPSTPHPGDIIFVPQKPLGRSSVAQVMDVLQILRFAVETGVFGALLPNISDSPTSIDLGSDSYQKRNIVDEFRPELYENYKLWQETQRE